MGRIKKGAEEKHDFERRVRISEQGRAKLKALLEEVKSAIRLRDSAALGPTQTSPDQAASRPRQ
jgi:hypothetical protein